MSVLANSVHLYAKVCVPEYAEFFKMCESHKLKTSIIFYYEILSVMKYAVRYYETFSHD